MSRSMRLTCAVAAISLAAALMPTAAFAERTLGLDTGSFRFKVDPGDNRSAKITALNAGTEDLHVKVYAANQSFDGKGNVAYQVPTNENNPLTSPASWIRVYLPPDSKSINNTPYIELPVGSEHTVKFDVKVPTGVAPGDHSILLFFEMFDPTMPESSGASILGRIGARIKLRVSGVVVDKLTVEPFVVPDFVLSDKSDYAFTINNDGNIDKNVDATVELLDRNKRVVSSRKLLSDAVVFAETVNPQVGKLSLGSMPLGPFTTRVKVNYDQENPFTGKTEPKEIIEERAFWAIPMWLLVALGLSVLLVLMIALWKAGQRKERRREEQRRRDLETEILKRQLDALSRAEEEQDTA